MRPRPVSDNQEFVASERWKCSKSPSGAHHWIIQSDRMTCKFCDAIKMIETPGNGKIRTETK